MVINEILSKFFYINGGEGDGVLFHIPTGRFFRVYQPDTKEGLAKAFVGVDMEKETEKMLSDIDQNQKNTLCSCTSCKEDIKNARDFTIRKLALVLTSSCNMRCTYCYANYGMYNYKKEETMTPETLESTLKYFTNEFKAVGAIQFFGGEPTLKEELIYQTVDFFEGIKQKGLIDKMPIFGIVTNAVYMPDKLVEYFKKYDFQSTVSLDGPMAITDKLRVDCSGKGKYKQIYDNIEKIRKAQVRGLSFECTYTAEHIRMGISLVDLVKFFEIEFEQTVVHIAPVNIDNNDSLSLVPYIDQYNSYVEELVNYTFDQILENKKLCSTNIILGLITRIITQMGQQAICPAGVNTFSVAHDKKISPCFMYTSKDDISYGDVGEDADLILSKAYDFDKNINNKEKVQECGQCFARNVCSSCLGSFEIGTDKVEISNPIYCESIKTAVHHVLKRMVEIKRNSKQWEEFNAFISKENNEKGR